MNKEDEEKDFLSIAQLIASLLSNTSLQGVLLSQFGSFIGNVIAQDEFRAYLTKALALELAPEIRVNAVAPGWIETPFTVAGLNLSEDPAAFRKQAEQMHALNRIGLPEEIAKVIFFLATPESSFVTGTTLVADGGYLIKN